MQACISWFFHFIFYNHHKFFNVLSSFFPTLSQFVFNWLLGFSYTNWLYENYSLTYNSKFKWPKQEQTSFDIKMPKARIPMYMLYLKCLINHIFFISSHLFHEFSNSYNSSFNFISKFLNSNELIKKDLHPTLTLFVSIFTHKDWFFKVI